MISCRTHRAIVRLSVLPSKALQGLFEVILGLPRHLGPTEGPPRLPEALIYFYLFIHLDAALGLLNRSEALVRLSKATHKNHSDESISEFTNLKKSLQIT